jgi:hypothetical protein
VRSLAERRDVANTFVANHGSLAIGWSEARAGSDGVCEADAAGGRLGLDLSRLRHETTPGDERTGINPPEGPDSYAPRQPAGGKSPEIVAATCGN